MTRLTNEQRLAAVRAYKNGDGSYDRIAARFKISGRTLRDLVALCESQGEDALVTPASQQHYPPELKAAAVQAYLDGQGSQREICARFRIRSRSQLRSWVKQYHNNEAFGAGPPPPTPQTPPKARRTTIEERIEIVSFCLEHQRDYTLTIRTYHVSYNQIRTWVRKYLAGGADALQDRRGQPKPDHLMTETERLRAELRLLQADNRRLQVENTALKKLRSLERGWD